MRIGRWRRWTLYFVGLGVWMSGGLWLLLHYCFARQGEFGPTTHPLEPWSLKMHGAFAFASIWVFGLLWGVHITMAWPGRRRRSSGGVLTGVFLWLIVSGYLLYYLGDDSARSVVSIVHWTTGLLCPIAFGVHRLGFRRHGARAADQARNHRDRATSALSS